MTVVDASPGTLPTPKRPWGRWGHALLAAAVTAGAARFLWGFDWRSLGATLGRATWSFAVVAAAINLGLNTMARVLRWRALLPPSPRDGRPPPVGEMASVLLQSQAVSNLLPLRAGEAVRAIRLRADHGYPLRAMVATQALERPVEALSMMTMAIPVALLPAFASRVVPLMGVLIPAAVLAIVLVTALARRGRGPLGGVLRPAADAVAQLHSPRVWLRAYGWSVASDLLDAAMIGLCLAAVGLHLAPPAWCAVLVAVNVAIAVPAGPGHVGVLEAGAVLALSALGVDREQALAFALIYHATHILPTTLGGAVALLARRREEAQP